MADLKRTLSVWEKGNRSVMIKKLLLGIACTLPLIMLVLGTIAYLWSHGEAGGRELLLFFVILGFSVGIVMCAGWLFAKGLRYINEVTAPTTKVVGFPDHLRKSKRKKDTDKLQG